MLSRLALASALLVNPAWAADGTVARHLNLTEALGSLDTPALTWTPGVGGVSRYRFTLPETGIKNAVKYRDTAPLFYLADVEDAGLTLTSRPNSFALRVDVDDVDLTYSLPITHAIDLTLGQRVGGESSTYAGLSKKVASGSRRLDIFSAMVSGHGLDAQYAGVRLSNQDRYETFWSISFEDDGAALFGRRWFAPNTGYDTAAAAGYQNSDAFIRLAIEKSEAGGAAYAGIEFVEGEDKPKLKFGLRFTLSATAGTPIIDGISPQGTPTLKHVARHSLPTIWRDALTF